MAMAFLEQLVHTHVKLVICLLVFATLFSCTNNKPDSDITVRHLNADRKYIVRENGNTFYKQELYTGTLRHYYPDSSLKSITTLYKGKMHGKYSMFWEDGSKHEIRFFKNNKKDSVHTNWYKNGTVKFRFRFKMGSYHGKQEEFNENGFNYSVKNYNNGKEEGVFKTYSKDSSLVTNYIAKNGKRYGVIGFKPCATPAKN